MTALFISYASADQAIAMEVCALLETRGVSCWIAPRDVAPGAQWDESLLHAIDEAGAFLLLLSAASNDSPFVKNEVNRAFSKKKAIFTFRIEDVVPAGSLEFYLARHHWTDGFGERLEPQVHQLAASVTALVGGDPLSAVVAPAPKTIARPKAASTPRPRDLATLGAVTIVAALAGGVLVWIATRNRAPEQPALHLAIPFPGDDARFLAIAPDGRRLLLKPPAPGLLVVYALDTGETRSLKDTSTARTPFWSPDGRTIAFFEDGALKTMSAAGGPAQTLCEGTGAGAGGTWSADGVVLLGSDDGAIKRVAATGGACTDLVKGTPTARAAYPRLLPDGDHFLYFRGGNRGGLFAASLANPDGHRVLPDASSAEFVADGSPAATGHLLFVRDGALMAQKFDVNALDISGEPEVVSPQADFTASRPQIAVTASNTGTVVYLTNSRADKQLAWHDRSGKVLDPVALSGDRGSGISLSPDGKRVAFIRDDARSAAEARLVDFESGRDVRLFTPPIAASVVWSPDAARFVFHVNGGETHGFYIRPLAGGPDELLVRDPDTRRRAPSDWSRDGRWILYTEVDPQTQGDIWLLPVPPTVAAAVAAKPVALLRTAADESHAQISPDGRWMAYTSNESGAYEVYLRPFGGTTLSSAPALPVSSMGGQEPRWRADGKELFYWTPIAGTRRYTLMAVPIGVGANPAGTPVPLFEFQMFPFIVQGNQFSYSPSADGQRFLINVAVGQAQGSIDVILNWAGGTKQ